MGGAEAQMSRIKTAYYYFHANIIAIVPLVNGTLFFIRRNANNFEPKPLLHKPRTARNQQHRLRRNINFRSTSKSGGGV